MIDKPQIADTEAQPAAVIHLTIPADQCPAEFPVAVKELVAALDEQGLKPAGSLFDHHLRMPSETFDLELGFPVTAPVTPSGRVKAGELPAAKVVRTVYHGPYEGLPQGWVEFDEQSRELVAQSGLERAPSLWQVYLVGPESDPDPSSWRTELNAPLREMSS